MSGVLDNVLTEPADQPTTTAAEIGGATSEGSPAAEKLLLPSGSATEYVFATEWHSVFNGNLICFRPGVGYQIDAALLTFLNAQSAPITAV